MYKSRRKRASELNSHIAGILNLFSSLEDKYENYQVTKTPQRIREELIKLNRQNQELQDRNKFFQEKAAESNALVKKLITEVENLREENKQAFEQNLGGEDASAWGWSKFRGPWARPAGRGWRVLS